MSKPGKASPGPLLLLVDDNTESLELRREMFDSVGFATIAVVDEHSAVKEFIASPGIDFVITDIALHPKTRPDKTGVKLAKQLREIRSDLPIVGYSAAIAKEELTDKDRALFTSFYSRGDSNPDEIMKHVDAWKKLANLSRKARFAKARARLEQYRNKYGQPSPEYSIMRFLVPNRLVQSTGDISSVEDVLRNAGFELRVINRGTVRRTVEDGVAPLQSSLLIWLRRNADVTISEVYGYPEFYSYGENEEESIANLLLLMDGFYRDFKTERANSTRSKQISEFLNSVF